MQISQVCCARPGGVNEDYACTGSDWAVVALLRGAERSSPREGRKQQDDATAVYFRPSET